MAVEVNFDRKAVQFKYDTSLVQGDTVTITAQNVDTEDESNREAKNTGLFVLTYPYDFVGSDEITVEGSDGGSDSGTVSVGA